MSDDIETGLARFMDVHGIATAWFTDGNGVVSLGPEVLEPLVNAARERDEALEKVKHLEFVLEQRVYANDACIKQRDEARTEARMHESLWREAEEASAATARERDEAQAERDASAAATRAAAAEGVRLRERLDAAEAQRDALAKAADKLVWLKRLKRKIEAGTATDEDARTYRTRKAFAWVAIEKALAALEEA